MRISWERVMFCIVLFASMFTSYWEGGHMSIIKFVATCVILRLGGELRSKFLFSYLSKLCQLFHSQFTTKKWRTNFLCLFLLLRCSSSFVRSSWSERERERERERVTLFYAFVFSNAVFFRILIHVRRRIVGGSSTNSVEIWSANSLFLCIYIYIPWRKSSSSSSAVLDYSWASLSSALVSPLPCIPGSWFRYENEEEEWRIGGRLYKLGEKWRIDFLSLYFLSLFREHVVRRPRQELSSRD